VAIDCYGCRRATRSADARSVGKVCSRDDPSGTCATRARLEGVVEALPRGTAACPRRRSPGQTISVSSSTSSCSSSHGSAAAAVHLQLAAGLAFSSRMAVSRSPESTVVSAHCGSVMVFDATNFGREFSARRTGSRRRPARPSTRRRARRCAGRTGTRRRAGRSRRCSGRLLVARAAAPSRPGRTRGRASGCCPPFACITPSTVIWVLVTSFMIVVPSGRPSWATSHHCYERGSPRSDTPRESVCQRSFRLRARGERGIHLKCRAAP
jgi:hypothetical protein